MIFSEFKLRFVFPWGEKEKQLNIAGVFVVGNIVLIKNIDYFFVCALNIAYHHVSRLLKP